MVETFVSCRKHFFLFQAHLCNMWRVSLVSVEQTFCRVATFCFGAQKNKYFATGNVCFCWKTNCCLHPYWPWEKTYCWFSMTGEFEVNVWTFHTSIDMSGHKMKRPELWPLTVDDVMVRFTSDLRTSMHLAASSAKIWDTGVPKRWPLTSSEHDSGRPGPGRASGATVSAQCSNRSPSKQGLSFRIQNAIFMDHIDPLFGAISLAVLSESHQWFASCDSDRFVEEKYFESPRVKWWRCTLDSQLAQKEQHLAA